MIQTLYAAMRILFDLLPLVIACVILMAIMTVAAIGVYKLIFKIWRD